MIIKHLPDMLRRTVLPILILTMTFCGLLCAEAQPQQPSMEDVRASILLDVGDPAERAAKPSDAPDFFGHGEARLVGYLKGYDPQQHPFSTVQIHLQNNLTRESVPIAANITSDGWFTADIPLEYPKMISFVVGSAFSHVYMEQGSRMGLIIDISDPNDVLDSDRSFKHQEFIGPLARLNNELRLFKPERFLYAAYSEAMEKAAAMPPMEAVAFFRELRERNMAALDDIKNTISADAHRLLSYAEYEYFGQLLGDFEMSYKDASRDDPSKPPLPVEFYGFLKEMPLDDPGLLTTGSWVFLNRYEYLAPLTDIRLSPYRVPSFEEYLQRQRGIVLTAEDTEYITLRDSLNLLARRGQRQDSLLVAAYAQKYQAFMGRYDEKYYDDYNEYTDRLMPKTQIEGFRIEAQRGDSVYYNVLGMQPSLFYDITKVRSVNGRSKSERFLDYCRVVSDAVRHPFLKDEVWRLFEASLPKAGDDGGYTLPAGQATDAFKAITDRFLGNLVLVDFWGTGCGPCVGHIQSDKEQRARLEKEGTLTYVFISDDSWSPQKEHYDQFVEEQGLTNAFRLSQDDMNRFMQLFKFSGLPHYVLLGPDGKVLDDDFGPYGDMNALLEKYKK